MEFKDDSWEKSVEDRLNEIPDIESLIGEAIDELINDAPGALDTLKELSNALGDDPDFAATITSALSGKVDKIAGKGLSAEDFTSILKSKLDGIAEGATANDTDANLKNRVNHTGAQAISTVTGLQSALDSKAADSDLTDLAARVTALENWKGVMPKKSYSFTGTTDSNGDLTIDLTSAGFSSTPSIAVGFIFNNNNYGSFFNIKSLSSTHVQIRAMRNKNTYVGALGGDVDPDQNLAETAIRVIATEF